MSIANGWRINQKPFKGDWPPSPSVAVLGLYTFFVKFISFASNLENHDESH
jgi:hypothetical protein